MRRRRIALALALAPLAFALPAPPAARAQSVVTYHNTPDRSGLYVAPALTSASAPGVHLDTRFKASFQGQVYAQPLYWSQPGGPELVIVATESNELYAFSGATGAVLWKRTLGQPVALDVLPCGNINPVGVTGTPAIDPVAKILYVDALVQRATGPRHAVFAYSLVDGSKVDGWPLDVGAGVTRLGQSFDSTVQGERSALAVVNGQLYVSYAGNAGDCGSYHGVVVGFDLAAKQVSGVWQTRGAGGGIWGQGGIAYDGTSMFMATGNTKGVTTWSDGEAVFRLDPALAHSTATTDYYTPSNWLGLDNADLDIGGTAPVPVDVPLSTGTLARVLALGKDGNAYLLDRANLGGLGGQLAITHVSTGGIKTAPAIYPLGQAAMAAFQGIGAACPAGQAGNLTALRIAGGTAPITTAWCAAFTGGGAPIVTTTDGSGDPIVWVVGAGGDGLLHGFRGSDGAVLFAGGGTVMTGLHHFQTLIVGGRHLYVAADNTVYAFAF